MEQWNERVSECFLGACHGRQSREDGAFPGRAWERGVNRARIQGGGALGELLLNVVDQLLALGLLVGGAAFVVLEFTQRGGSVGLSPA